MHTLPSLAAIITAGYYHSYLNTTLSNTNSLANTNLANIWYQKSSSISNKHPFQPLTLWWCLYATKVVLNIPFVQYHLHCFWIKYGAFYLLILPLLDSSLKIYFAQHLCNQNHNFCPNAPPPPCDHLYWFTVCRDTSFFSNMSNK